ncbi:MAG: ABC transporter ATP-binding protein [Chloroflexi bacterium]|nr:ABC transporter ATP-binding protein [Chloroflexota bacterium]
MERDTAIQTNGLTKDYGLDRGLFDLDLEVTKGEIFGFLGSNGAGKTTAIKLLMGLIFPTAGSANVLGMDTHAQSIEIKKHVGYVPGELPQFGGLRAAEVVARIAGLRGGIDASLVEQMAKRFDLDLGRKFRELSRGNKQKLAIVLGFMHRPRVLIMDEPTGGLDPLLQQEFNEMVREVQREDVTVFLSSHILSEVEHLCHRVGIIRNGRLVQVEELNEVRALQVRQVEIDFASAPPIPELEAADGVEKVVVTGNHVACTLRGSFGAILGAINGHEVLNLVSREPSLEEIFLLYYRDDEPVGEASNAKEQ